MKVISKDELQFWYLLEHHGMYYLHVYGIQRYCEYSLSIQLSAKDIEFYQQEGGSYLNKLAYKIDLSQPPTNQSFDELNFLKGEITSQISEEIMDFEKTYSKQLIHISSLNPIFKYKFFLLFMLIFGILSSFYGGVFR